MSYRVLYVEDEQSLAQIVGDGLELSGYELMLVRDGGAAKAAFESFNPDICILDIMLPVLDGYEVARLLKGINPEVPIIFLSAKTLTADVVKGFKSGGDDYLKKPFSMDELLARMEALLSRYGRKSSVGESLKQEQYHFGGCVLDTVSQRLKTSAGDYNLSYKESALLELLVQQKNNVLERQYALQTIWGEDSYYNTRSMDVFMSHIRKMLKGEEGIQLMNIRSIGFKLICS
ncbi:MAG: response regulator transcription factor [Pedobacter sp.]|nr:MAG: response regulator transcription factor [Pedobacter sp.]